MENVWPYLIGGFFVVILIAVLRNSKVSANLNLPGASTQWKSQKATEVRQTNITAGGNVESNVGPSASVIQDRIKAEGSVRATERK